jgi:AAA domain (Cdc48 subfamily)
LPDKALDLFLQIFDEGTLTDAQGRKCDFRESVFILTSNLGSGEVKKRRMGFGAEEDEVVETPTHLEAVKRHFRPELVNRLTKVVHFKPLELETAREILGKLVAEFNQRLAVAAVGVPQVRSHDRRKISGEDGAAGGIPATVTDRRYKVRIALDESAVDSSSGKDSARNSAREILSGRWIAC